MSPALHALYYPPREYMPDRWQTCLLVMQCDENLPHLDPSAAAEDVDAEEPTEPQTPFADADWNRQLGSTLEALKHLPPEDEGGGL